MEDTITSGQNGGMHNFLLSLYVALYNDYRITRRRMMSIRVHLLIH